VIIINCSFFIFGPADVIIGGLMGALAGKAVEYAELQKKKEKQYV